MSNFSIIHDVSTEFRRRVFDGLRTAPDVDFALTDAATNISLAPPNAAAEPSVRASLYLYHLDIDKHLRNQPPLVDPLSPNGLRMPPIPLELRFLLTPLDENELNNHMLLGRVIQHFYDDPKIDVLDGVPLDDSFGGASPALRVRPDLLSMEQLAQIWNAFSSPYRLSVSLLIEVVAVDSAKPPRRVPRVSESVLGAGLRAREEAL